jgi:hypothetical protein
MVAGMERRTTPSRADLLLEILCSEASLLEALGIKQLIVVVEGIGEA